MNKRHKLNRKAIMKNLENDWSIYRKTRNKVNIELRNSKKDYYSTKIAGDSAILRRLGRL